MYYLSACNRGLCKNYYCYVFLWLEKSSSIMKNIFNSLLRNVVKWLDTL